MVIEVNDNTYITLPHATEYIDTQKVYSHDGYAWLKLQTASTAWVGLRANFINGDFMFNSIIALKPFSKVGPRFLPVTLSRQEILELVYTCNGLPEVLQRNYAFYH